MSLLGFSGSLACASKHVYGRGDTVTCQGCAMLVALPPRAPCLGQPSTTWRGPEARQQGSAREAACLTMSQQHQRGRAVTSGAV